MNDGDHRECPIELRACPEHHGVEFSQEPNTFSAALQSMLDNVEIIDDGDGGTKPESK